jgi:hypothetical protein
MVQSTRASTRAARSADLWRRSLNVLEARVPPPAFLTLDAPTRESCRAPRDRRHAAQALALWNDEQFVEAARSRGRALVEDGGEGARLARVFRRCTGRAPDPSELERLAKALHGFLRRYRARPPGTPRARWVGAAPLAEGSTSPGSPRGP